MSRVYVSDHAVLRYLERHCGIDCEGVRRMIEAAAAPAIECGAASVTVNGAKFAIIGRSVTTTLHPTDNIAGNIKKRKGYKRSKS